MVVALLLIIQKVICLVTVIHHSTLHITYMNLIDLCCVRIFLRCYNVITVICLCLGNMQIKKISSLDFVFLKYHAKLCALPIGGIATLFSAPIYSDKILVFKQSSFELLVISHSVASSSRLYIVSDLKHMYSLSSGYFFFYNYSITNCLHTSIILDYESYSQIE
jgi:hypothetical protein